MEASFEEAVGQTKINHEEHEVHEEIILDSLRALRVLRGKKVF